MDAGGIADKIANKPLIGVGLAIIGLLGVLYAPKPLNTISLILFLAGIAMAAYAGYNMLTSQPATQAVPTA